jgi:hypothetical protein
MSKYIYERYNERHCAFGSHDKLIPIFPGRGKMFLISTQSRPALGPHPPSYPMDTGVSFPEGKVVGGGVKQTIHRHLLPSSRMVEPYLQTPNIFMAYNLISTASVV